MAAASRPDPFEDPLGPYVRALAREVFTTIEAQKVPTAAPVPALAPTASVTSFDEYAAELNALREKLERLCSSTESSPALPPLDASSKRKRAIASLAGDDQPTSSLPQPAILDLPTAAMRGVSDDITTSELSERQTDKTRDLPTQLTDAERAKLEHRRSRFPADLISFNDQPSESVKDNDQSHEYMKQITMQAIKIDTQKAEIDRLNSVIAAQEKTLGEHTKALLKFNKKADGYKVHISGLETCISKLKNDIMKCQTKENQHADTLDRYNLSMTSLQKELSYFKGRVMELEGDDDEPLIQTNDTGFKDACKRISALEAELEKERAKNVASPTPNSAPTSLLGAAHLFHPGSHVNVLPEAVLACYACWAANRLCDNKTTCTQCRESRQVCKRWVCSVKVSTNHCGKEKCGLSHGPDGWLVAEKERPNW